MAMQNFSLIFWRRYWYCSLALISGFVINEEGIARLCHWYSIIQLNKSEHKEINFNQHKLYRLYIFCGIFNTFENCHNKKMWPTYIAGEWCRKLLLKSYWTNLIKYSANQIEIDLALFPKFSRVGWLGSVAGCAFIQYAPVVTSSTRSFCTFGRWLNSHGSNYITWMWEIATRKRGAVVSTMICLSPIDFPIQ